MYWNYRMMDKSHENGGDPWVVLVECHYNDDGSVAGYTDITLGCGSENAEVMGETLALMAQACYRPILKESECVGLIMLGTSEGQA